MRSLTDDIVTQISGGALQQLSQQPAPGQARTAGAIAAARARNAASNRQGI